MKAIKDLIYFDYDKAKSLNSQLKGGIFSELTRAIGEEGELSSEFGFDIKVLKGKVGGTDKGKTLRTEKIEIYHELLNEIESSLYDKNILTDLNISFDHLDKSFEKFISTIPDLTYIKSTGWSSFEDFERFKK